MTAGTISGPVTMVERYGEVEHPPLRRGRWWACDHPERPAEEFKTEFQFTCVKCFPLWEMCHLDGWVFYNHDTRQPFIPPTAHGDRFHWYMDEDVHAPADPLP